MKGIVFNLLEEIVAREYGEDTWDRLLDRAELDGVYTSLGSYEDGDLVALVRAASAVLGLPPDAIVRWFGSAALPLLADSYPQFFAPHSSTRSFLLTLNDIIHPEVRKLYPGADVPTFDFQASSNGVWSWATAPHESSARSRRVSSKEPLRISARRSGSSSQRA